MQRAYHRRDDRGSVLVIAMMVMGVAISLSLVIVGLSITSGRTSGHDRQRLVAVDAAEAGIDAAYATMQSSGVSLPCTSVLPDVKTYPDTASTAVTITYYNAAGVMGCSGTPLTLTSGVPTRAVIASVGTTGALSGASGVRKMEALVNLAPVTGNGGDLTRALDGDAGITISNGATINGSPAGSDADTYTNGNFMCGNSPDLHGDIHAPFGSITMTNTCTASGDVWARDNVALSGNKTIGGRVISSLGSITADGNTDVNGTLIAKGAIGWSKCTPSKCQQNQSTVASPPTQTFPILRGDTATMTEWANRGYNVISQPSGVACGVATGDWIDSHAAAWTQKTLLRTACYVEFRSTKSVRFNNDFALFASGGIVTFNQVGFESTTSTTRNVYMVVPYDAVTTPTPCAAGAPPMGTDNNFSSTSEITLLWYSPCNVDYGNHGGSYGAVYSGGQITTNNNFTLTYRPVTVYGLDPSSQPTLSYKLDIVYKREDRVS